MNKKQSLPWENPRFRNWVAIIRAEKAIVRELTKALIPFGLKIAQLDLMMNVYRHPGISQQELARRLLVGRSNITMLVPDLEKLGLITRDNDANDKRVMRLSLTSQGETLLLQALEVYAGLIDRVMAQSTDAECNAMGEQMRRVIAELGED